MKHIITKEQIEKINILLFRNGAHQTRKILSELPELKKDTLREDIQRLIRNNGRSTLIGIDKLKEVIE